MNTKSRLAENPGGEPQPDDLSPQERLQRLADAFDASPDWPEGHILDLVAAAQERPAAAATAPIDRAEKKSGWLRNVALFLTIVVAVTALAGLILHTFGPRHVHENASVATGTVIARAGLPPTLPATAAQPQSSDATATGNAAGGQPDAAAPPRVTAAPTSPYPPNGSNGSAPSRQAADRMADVATAGAASDPTRLPRPATQRTTLPAADSSSAKATGVDPDAPQPILAVYYASGSALAESNARNLAAQLGPNIASSDLQAQPELPKGAVVRYASARNHSLARKIGDMLANMGYSWRIENGSNAPASQSNLVEIWIPNK